MPVSQLTSWADPPAYILDAIGGAYDASRHYWNPDTQSIVARDGSGSWGYSHIPDPSLGTDVVTNLSDYNRTGQAQLHYAQGQQPVFGFGDSAQDYDGGDAPNSGMFVSADPQAIGEYQNHRSDVVNRGVATVAGVTGGMVGLGHLLGPMSAAAPAAGAGAASGLAPGTASSVGFGAMTGVPVGAGIAAAPLTAGTGALAGGLLPGVTAGAGGLTGLSTGGGVAGAAANALTGDGSGAGGAIGNALRDAPAWLDYLMPAVNALLGANAANQASDAQAGAMDRAIAENARQYNQSREDMTPWMDAGRDALNQLSNPGANFLASPDYDFRRSEGMRGLENSFASRGMGQSGNALRALTEFNSGLASNEFGNWHNRQASRAGLGQTTASNLGALGANSAAQTGNYLGAQGDARASGYLGRTNQFQNALYDGYDNFLRRRRA